ncbi:MAG: sigma-70 family RNA polymerase sigma factor [Reichenbachiella sp.]
MTTSKKEFIDILKEHKAILYKITRSYCIDPDDRKDLEQEIVIQIWKSLENYNDNYKLSTWIYRIGLNVAISHLRKSGNRKKTLEPIAELTFDLPEDSEEAEILSERTKILYEVINQLNPLNKALIMLYLDGKSHNEISDIIGISESNVGTKLGRIKSLLQHNIKLQYS